MKPGEVVIFSSFVEWRISGTLDTYISSVSSSLQCLCSSRIHTISMLLDFFLFCWYFKLGYLWIVFKRMITWLLFLHIQGNISVYLSCCLKFGYYPYSLLLCVYLLCTYVRVSGVVAVHISHFEFLMAFLLMGWILLCFSPCDPVSGKLSLRIYCWVIILKPLALLPVKWTWTYNGVVLNKIVEFLFSQNYAYLKNNVSLKYVPSLPIIFKLLIMC